MAFLGGERRAAKARAAKRQEGGECEFPHHLGCPFPHSAATVLVPPVFGE